MSPRARDVLDYLDAAENPPTVISTALTEAQVLGCLVALEIRRSQLIVERQVLGAALRYVVLRDAQPGEAA